MHLLVLRFSSFGDVALTLPVFKTLLHHDANLHITFVTRPKFVSLFQNVDRLTCMGVDVDSSHKGVIGLFQLFQKLRKTNPNYVVDLHDHIRTHVLSFYFRMSGIYVKRFDKGRKDKKKLTSKENKSLKPLPSTVTRYLQPFEELGLKTELVDPPYFLSPRDQDGKTQQFLTEKEIKKKNGSWIGIAPFAKYPLKVWGFDKLDKLIGELVHTHDRIFLFGGGTEEERLLNQLVAKDTSKITSVAGSLKLESEMSLIKSLDVMLTMDSANLHLASLVGTPTISIWGPTHIYAGFGPLGKHKIIERKELTCRPCSVFGQKTCWRGDHACMDQISVQQVLDTIHELEASQ